MSISNSLTRLISHIKNGQKANILVIQAPKSKINVAFLRVLQDNGFIRGYRENLDDPFFIEILLKYRDGKPAINDITQVSKPSKRVYLSIKDLNSRNRIYKSKTKNKSRIKLEQFLQTNFKDTSHIVDGTLIVSTSKGIFTHLDAYKFNVGGEVLCRLF
jgi:small subunit ribosomal protein S8